MKYLLLFVLFPIVGALSAQNISFVDGNGDLLTDTITISYDRNDPSLISTDDEGDTSYVAISPHDAFVKINTESKLGLVMTRKVITYVNDSIQIDEWGDGNLTWKQPEDQFCWGQCVYLSGDVEYHELTDTINENKSIDLGILIHYLHYKITGVTTLEYEVFNGSTSEAKLVVKFEIIDNTVEIENNSFANVNVYPNPCSGRLNINGYDNVNELMITNLIGQVVYSSRNVGEITKLNVSDLKAGLYVLVLKDENNQIYTERIIKN